jgi:uncharacterized membrane protein YfcA
VTSIIAVVTDAELLAIAATFAGGACHSATGFGFALVAAPLVAAALPPEMAVSTILVVSIGLSSLTLVSEGRRPEPLWREAAGILAWGAAGALLGAYLLERLDRTALQLFVSAGVGAALAARTIARRGADAEAAGRTVGAPPSGAARARGPGDQAGGSADDPAPRRWLPAVGLAAGALTTTTTTNGPPLLLYLLGRGVPAARVRDTLSVLFVAFGAIGVGAIALGEPDLSLPRTSVVAALAGAAALGQITGRPLFARLAPARYEQVAGALLLVSVAVGGAYALA